MASLSLGAVRKFERNGQSSLETFVRVVQTLGLTQELETLFEFKPTAIAALERAEFQAAGSRISNPSGHGRSRCPMHRNLCLRRQPGLDQVAVSGGGQ